MVDWGDWGDWLAGGDWSSQQWKSEKKGKGKWKKKEEWEDKDARGSEGDRWADYGGDGSDEEKEKGANAWESDGIIMKIIGFST